MNGTQLGWMALLLLVLVVGGTAWLSVGAIEAEPEADELWQRADLVFDPLPAASSGRFDDYLRRDHAALFPDEKEWLEVFLDLGCASCHNGATVGARSFRKFGLNAPYWIHTGSGQVDEGRAAVTGDPDDLYVFKVASLRNVAETAPYFHDGSVATLEEAVVVMARLQVGVELTLDQKDNLAAFLRSLTGERPVLAARMEAGAA